MALAVYKSRAAYLLHLRAMILDFQNGRMGEEDFRNRLRAMAECQFENGEKK